MNFRLQTRLKKVFIKVKVYTSTHYVIQYISLTEQHLATKRSLKPLDLRFKSENKIRGIFLENIYLYRSINMLSTQTFETPLSFESALADSISKHSTILAFTKKLCCQA